MKLHIHCVVSAVSLAALVVTAQAGDSTPSLPPHPRLLFTRAEIAGIKQRIAAEPWAKNRFASLRAQADQWLQRDITLPPRGGQWFHYYSCPKHGARLRTEGPTRHVCPIDGEVFTGYPYDDVVLSTEHNRLAGAIRVLGITFQLTGEERYAVKAREILLAYAAKYASYPLHDIRGQPKIGGGKVGPQTLDESTWLITVAEGADCIWDTLSNREQTAVRGDLLLPATDIIHQHKLKIHNIQCWKNSAVGLTGLLLGDKALIDEAIDGEYGYRNQMAKGVTPDGVWYEGAWGYHFYTVSAVLHLTEAAHHCGLDLYGPEFKRMFDAPLAFAMPNLELPAFNDSSTVSLAGQASAYEVAFARYHDPRYAAILTRGRRESDMAMLYGALLPNEVPTISHASRNFPASGYGILAAGKGADAVWFCMKYGPHGGGHGHPDKLGFVLYGEDQILAPDPGTANYGVPIQSGWYRTTLAHNTLTVDEESQKPAQGQCEVFLSGKDFSAVSAVAGDIYSGVSFRRTVALIENQYLVFIDQVRADREHTFDLVYHNRGQLAAPSGAMTITLPNRPGYSYLRDPKSLSLDKPLQLVFNLRDDRKVTWALAGGQPTTCMVGTGVGAHTEDRVPLVLARRQASNTTYIWCLSLGASSSAASVDVEPVRADGAEVAAARLTTSRGIHLLLVNPHAVKVEIGGRSLEAKLVHLTSRGNGQWQVQDSFDR